MDRRIANLFADLDRLDAKLASVRLERPCPRVTDPAKEDLRAAYNRDPFGRPYQRPATPEERSAFWLAMLPGGAMLGWGFAEFVIRPLL